MSLSGRVDRVLFLTRPLYVGLEFSKPSLNRFGRLTAEAGSVRFRSDCCFVLSPSFSGVGANRTTNNINKSAAQFNKGISNSGGIRSFGYGETEYKQSECKKAAKKKKSLFVENDNCEQIF